MKPNLLLSGIVIGISIGLIVGAEVVRSSLDGRGDRKFPYCVSILLS